MLIIVRGLPGTGKTTAAEVLAAGYKSRGVKVGMHAADDYFYRDGDGNISSQGDYKFDPGTIGDAHRYCRVMCVRSLTENDVTIIHNTSTTWWEVDTYKSLADDLGVKTVVFDLFDAGMSDEELFERNVHGVPLSVITAMRGCYDHDWRYATYKSSSTLSERLVDAATDGIEFLAVGSVFRRTKHICVNNVYRVSGINRDDNGHVTGITCMHFGYIDPNGNLHYRRTQTPYTIEEDEKVVKLNVEGFKRL